ncbi:LacI family transcriptional regulator [Actinorhabdospora filicis]|uniref:LacI family transcriptional regulator n=1 Tax=Actinorhabdospora filicis TaxID=1785913 RepID=A0A9W6W9A7_9ACTN|nr:LacI family DNA-binding transcriptional regulator [Actinorhabdospora filicis]GLZ76475.1 LacI family transcriptional regulator [Actinorhabdospora filicis]
MTHPARRLSHRRPTIADIARRAGVSKGAVSYALNGRPGVSEETRRRILAIAAEVGWQPNSAARTLSGALCNVVGLALSRPARVLGIEPFFMALVSGLEAELHAHDYGLTLQIADGHASELAVYRRWWAERRVDGVLVCDLRVDDPRVPVLEELGLPAVVIGGPGHTGDLTSVWADDSAPLTETVEYLYALGHRRIAHVAGLSELLHTRVRTAAFHEVTSRLGLSDAITLSSDYTGEAGARITRRLLSSPNRPTAIVYDNDIMAVAGLSVAQELRVDVPGELSIVAWDDSPLCRLTHPALTALGRDIPAYGALAARRLLDVISGAAPAAHRDAPAELTIRGSTGAPDAKRATR